MIQIPITVDEVEDGVDSWPEGPVIGAPYGGSTRRVLVKGSRQVPVPGGSVGQTAPAEFRAELYVQHGADDDAVFQRVGQQFTLTIEEVTP